MKKEDKRVYNHCNLCVATMRRVYESKYFNGEMTQEEIGCFLDMTNTQVSRHFREHCMKNKFGEDISDVVKERKKQQKEVRKIRDENVKNKKAEGRVDVMMSELDINDPETFMKQVQRRVLLTLDSLSRDNSIKAEKRAALELAVLKELRASMESMMKTFEFARDNKKEDNILRELVVVVAVGNEEVGSRNAELENPPCPPLERGESAMALQRGESMVALNDYKVCGLSGAINLTPTLSTLTPTLSKGEGV